MPLDLHAEAERDLVDQIALIFEHGGMPPVSGRIVGRLLVCDPPHQSSTQLADHLNASRGAISTSTRMLIQAGLLERVRFAGDRAAYFRIRPGCWSELIHAEVERMRQLRTIGDHGMELLKDRTEEQNSRLRDFRDFAAFFEEEFPVLVEHWDNRSKT